VPRYNFSIAKSPSKLKFNHKPQTYSIRNQPDQLFKLIKQLRIILVMSVESYRFTVGRFECLAVSDGTFTYTPPTFPPPATFLFSNAPKDCLKQRLLEHNLKHEQWTEWITTYICLVISTGKHRVLVDTGANGLGPNTGKLLPNLRASRISPESIDIVILTHGHPDHIGGNTNHDGKLAFPHAQFVMWKDEWIFWNSEQAELHFDEHVRDLLLTYARKNLPPIQDQLSLIDRETEIVPGIHTVMAHGHTPGHMAVRITSMGKHLLCVSDAFLHPIHIKEPEWCAPVDFAHQQVATTRRRLCNLAVTKNALVLAFHFPFPGLGHIIRKNGQWRWQQ
jgi:glyoxylase-like metal-dependent hydrolase (beta-lactamase superfamily II)